MTETFVHLHLHTEFSIVDGMVRIPALMDKCVQQRMPAVAMTDQSNLFGLIKFYRSALKKGVKPIIGVDLNLLRHSNSPLVNTNAQIRDQTRTHCHQLAKHRADGFLVANTAHGLRQQVSHRELANFVDIFRLFTQRNRVCYYQLIQLGVS